MIYEITWDNYALLLGCNRMKKWVPGAADEAWKIMVCARDAARTDEAIQFIMGILTTAGNDHELGLSQLREMTGKQIVDGLVAYQKSAHDSVKNGLSCAD